MKSYFLFLSASLILIFSQTGCTTTAKMKCPDLVAKRTRPEPTARFLAKVERKKHHSLELKAAAPDNATAVPDNVITTEKSLSIKLPAFAARRMQEQDIRDANLFFKSQSQSGISLVKRENNKVYIQVKSPAELMKVAKSMAFNRHHSVAPYGGGGGGMAIASGVLGIVGFLCAFGPFIGFFALLCALLAVILGAISLHSERRGWAITGIVLGAITLAVAILFIRVVYIHFI